MIILLDCYLREGAYCEKSIMNGEKMKKIEKGIGEYAVCPGFLFLSLELQQVVDYSPFM